MQRAADPGLQNVILETDALMVVQAALSCIDDRSSASGRFGVGAKSIVAL